MLFSIKKKLSKTKKTGDSGEDLAVKFLKSKKYKILDRNYKNTRGYNLGEVDIVAKDGEQVVFVEVKTRVVSVNCDTLPEEAIGKKKLHRLNRISQIYLRSKNLDDALYRFDAVLITYGQNTKEPEIRHFESIFI